MQPEKKIELAFRALLKSKGWWTKKTHGNAFQSGFPDIFCSHLDYGYRWIEFKTPTGNLSPLQLKEFGDMARHGVRIWIITESSEEAYKKLFAAPNFYSYLMRSQ